VGQLLSQEWAGEQIQKQLKTAGIKIHDSSKQASDAVDTLAKFPYLRPSMGVMQGASSKISFTPSMCDAYRS